MIRKFALICLGVSSLAFGNKGQTHDEAMLRETTRASDLLESINSQLHHQTRLFIQIHMLLEELLDIKKPYDYDWYREETSKKPSETLQ